MLLMCLIAFLFSYSSCEIDLDDYIIDFSIIEEINNDRERSWTAGVNALFIGKKYKDVLPYLIPLDSPRFKKNRVVGKVESVSEGDLPTSFDTYTQWPHCKHAIRDQGQCGSCWAFSAVESLSDRFCAMGENVTLSPQDLVSCESDEYGCSGGYLSYEWKYLQEVGVVTDSCFPYVSGSGDVPSCPNKCVDSEDWNKKYKVKSSTKYGTVEMAQNAMLEYGSFQAEFTVYSTFLDYKSGVYDCYGSEELGGHVVKIQGWGVDSKSGKNYWNVANSWGASWGMNGYFWIVRGSDNCGIEDQMYGGIPDI